MESLQGIIGFEEEKFLQTHQHGEQVVSIRFNPLKIPSKIVDIGENRTNHSSLDIQPSHFPIKAQVPWTTHGYYLSARPSFTLDPMFHAGAYYVQEASSMFLEQALRQTVDLSQPLRVLDLCAAPGGKSTLIQSLISEKSLLVSNEVIKSRVHILTENLIKWGSENVVVTHNDPKDFNRLENYFDVIVVDAPCSGSGLFRRDPEAIKEWSEGNVQLCNQRQQRILADIWPALKKGGTLIYSTCSYSKEEDEDILDWMGNTFALEGQRLILKEDWRIVETISEKTNLYGYRFYPDKVQGEGFFIAAVKKKDGEDYFNFPKNKKSSFEKPSRNEESILKTWTKESEISFQKKENLVYAFPLSWLIDIQCIQSNLYVKKAGVLLGKLSHDELIPDHELALSGIIEPNTNSINLSRENAILYLRKEEFQLEETKKGWCLMQYENLNLGWSKILQNRANNYYPASWRILNKK